MSTSATDWHILYEGDLSDAPGRSESWTESVCYLGRGAWRLSIDGTDFGGTDSADSMIERLSTRGMVNWALVRDAEDREYVEPKAIPLRSSRDLDEDEGRLLNELGPRAERLLEIAEQVGADYCARCLRRAAKGSWPPVPTIRQVTGVTLRSVWRSRQPVYTVTTSAGPAYLHPPHADGTASLVMTSEGSMSMGTTISLPKRWRVALEAWRDKLDDLLAERSSSGSKTGG